jgi:hypothetical protein
MADSLEIKLQRIIEALSGGSGVTPPPGTEDQLKWYLDLIIYLLNEGGAGGGAVVPDNYFFTDFPSLARLYIAGWVEYTKG